MMYKWNQNSADDWRTNHWNASTSELAILYGEQKDALLNAVFLFLTFYENFSNDFLSLFELKIEILFDLILHVGHHV